MERRNYGDNAFVLQWITRLETIICKGPYYLQVSLCVVFKNDCEGAALDVLPALLLFFPPVLDN